MSATSLTERISELIGRSEFCRLGAALDGGDNVSVDGVFGGGCAFVAAGVKRHTVRPLLVVRALPETIDSTADDLLLFTGQEVLTFPPLETLNINELVGDDLFGQRTRLLKTLDSAADNTTNESANTIIVTSISALMQPVPSRELLRERSRTLQTGNNLDIETFVSWLVEGGYHPMPAIDLPGEFARRGHLLDIFAPDWEQPVRVEFFGDEIESIRTFDLATQRSLETVKSITLTRLRIDEEYNAQLLDYLATSTAVLLVEPEEIDKAGREYRERSDYLDRLLASSDVLRRVMRQPLCTLSNLIRNPAELNVSLRIESVERLSGTLQTVRTEIGKLATETLFIVCPTDSERSRLTELFADTTIAADNRLHCVVGQLSAGFAFDGTMLIGSQQLLARHEIRRTPRKHLGQVIDSFLELNAGDYVVHLSHGIACYRGLEMMKKGEQEEEHLHLQFADNVSLYIPTSKIGLVQKYVGSSKTKPKLAKIGGKLWVRQKKAVQEAVFDLAADMIDLQAARSTLPGIAFPPDSDWQESFDTAFPYQETPDQLLAIDAIKKDMMKPQPMDRLLCGDVGFGKTEVALRAVFKAVDAGYQVAILVPTTVLAQQHFRTISERMNEFPFTIAAMTRFQSKREQADTREKLEFGGVDIVVGTHGLASENIRFHNLGLVIIDEEQRFGVEHKERLKTLRKTVDVLTMTATPIPRTLHFSLLGIRDISNLETPPPDRMPVETKLVRFQPELIRSAILREINRGGQVFFVHNKVSDIETVAAKIQRIVPEARIAIGHAQMPDEALEQVMIDFIDYKFDVFVSTTIVESGLDIPNANTIFIDAADRFGLAELHQLRGRVGRYKHQAYCYLLLDANQSLNENAGKRLRAIEEFSHLGAGFNIAMRDLEIRGAGNILGTQQSGHIAAVGYELYCSFLEAAVRVLKRMPQKTVVEVEVELPGSAYIPKSYITVQKQKIDLYRRLSRVTTVDDVKDLENEMTDRFGKPPHVTRRLLKLAAIRVKAHLWRVRFIHVERGMMGDPNVSLDSGYVVMEFVSHDLMGKLKRALYPIPLRITNDMKAYCPFPKEIGSITGNPDEILKFVDDILSPIPR